MDFLGWSSFTSCFFNLFLSTFHEPFDSILWPYCVTYNLLFVYIPRFLSYSMAVPPILVWIIFSYISEDSVLFEVFLHVPGLWVACFSAWLLSLMRKSFIMWFVFFCCIITKKLPEETFVEKSLLWGISVVKTPYSCRWGHRFGAWSGN